MKGKRPSSELPSTHKTEPECQEGKTLAREDPAPNSKRKKAAAQKDPELPVLKPRAAEANAEPAAPPAAKGISCIIPVFSKLSLKNTSLT